MLNTDLILLLDSFFIYIFDVWYTKKGSWHNLRGAISMWTGSFVLYAMKTTVIKVFLH